MVMRKRIIGSILLFIALCVATFIGLFALWTFFRIEHIVIEGVKDVRGIQPFYGQHMLLVTEDTIKQNLISRNPSLADIRIEKKFPDTLIISAHSKRPTAILKLSDGMMYLAEDGTILEKNKQEPTSDIPLIRFYQPLFYNQYTVGDKLDIREVSIASHITSKVSELGVRVSSIDITNENMILLKTDEFDIAVTSQKDSDTQFQELEYTYKQLKIEGKKFTSLDVRFEKPIIKLQ